MFNTQTNFAVAQSGELLAGSITNQATAFNWRALRNALACNSRDHVGVFDHFGGGTRRTEWAVDTSASVTIVPNAQVGGAIRFTTTATNADKATLAYGLNFQPSFGPFVFECRFKSVSAITARSIELGVSDAISETNGLAFSSHDATPVAVATDAAVFGYNTGDSMTTWSALSVKNGGTPQVNILTAAPTLAYVTHTIVVDASGNASFYIDDVLVASHANALTPTVAYSPWCSLVSSSAAIKTIDLDYVLCVGELV